MSQVYHKFSLVERVVLKALETRLRPPDIGAFGESSAIVLRTY
jgi:hypothetical protein